MKVEDAIIKQRNYFKTGITKTYDFRIQALNKLLESVLNHEDEILNALYLDLGKSTFEGYECEYALVVEELKFVIRNLKKWMKIKKTPTPLMHFKTSSYTMYEPLGNVLLVSPWNYPIYLTLSPLIGSIASGNTTIIKMSSDSPATSKAIDAVIKDCFVDEYVTQVYGNENLLEQRYDYIFFTGSAPIGKLVLEHASKYLTPVTLELGGKSPVIIDKSADLKLSARRIVWGKYLNCGQTCVAPDHIYCPRELQEEFASYCKAEITKMFGSDILNNKDYPRIVNERHVNRIANLIENSKVYFGGEIIKEQKFISPTIVCDVDEKHILMEDELFAPIMPIIPYDNIEDVYEGILSREKPLALYLFSKNNEINKEVFNRLSFGGGCINDVVIHITNLKMSFGGVGHSGMGNYHGKQTFLTLSHKKNYMKKTTLFDVGVRYAPYTPKKFKWLKRFI